MVPNHSYGVKEQEFNKAKPISHSSNTPQNIRCDITEDDDTFTIVADLPGIDKSNINVTIDKNIITIQADPQDKANDKEDSHVRRIVNERPVKSLSRAFRLPERVSMDTATTSFYNGSITITFKKITQVHETRRLQIN
jgi:HSP20 family protein